MKSMLSSALVLVAMLVGQHSWAQPLDADQKAHLQKEIDYVGSLYGSVYAPKAWKESHLGWNLPAEIATAQSSLASAQNMHEARAALAKLIKSTQDYHVSFSFYSTEAASLPFQVKTVEGKTLIVYIDRTKLSTTAFPFNVGDEVLTLGQTPAAQVLTGLIKELGANIPGTDLAMADLFFTRRRGRSNMVVPQGPVTLSVKKASDQSVNTVSLTWEYTPEILDSSSSIQSAGLDREEKPLIQAPLFALTNADAISPVGDTNTYGLGVRNSFLPEFGSPIWQTADDNTFQASIYLNAENKLIGVIRIPGYIVGDYNKATKDFAGIIAHMEKNTAALIIDQNNNPGGSVFYLYTLASMLSDQTLTVPRHRVSLTMGSAKECADLITTLKNVKSDADAVDAIKEFNGYPVTYQLAVSLQDYCRNVMNEFHQGKTLSSPLFLWGVDQINPNPVHYTKPIVFLVNQLDFSGGDFMPATLQDNKRATIVGTRTAGAGGYVNQATFPNTFGLEMVSFTGSIAERVDLNPIENLGVTPDVALPMTTEDVRGGYKHYRSEINKLVKTLIK